MKNGPESSSIEKNEQNRAQEFINKISDYARELLRNEEAGQLDTEQRIKQLNPEFGHKARGAAFCFVRAKMFADLEHKCDEVTLGEKNDISFMSFSEEEKKLWNDFDLRVLHLSVMYREAYNKILSDQNFDPTMPGWPEIEKP